MPVGICICLHREDTKRLLPCPSLWSRSSDRFHHFPTHWQNLSIPYTFIHSLQPTLNDCIRSSSVCSSHSFFRFCIAFHPPVFGKFGTPHPLPKSPLRAHAHYTGVLHFHLHPSHTMVLHIGHPGVCFQSPCFPSLALPDTCVPLSDTRVLQGFSFPRPSLSLRSHSFSHPRHSSRFRCHASRHHGV